MLNPNVVSDRYALPSMVFPMLFNLSAVIHHLISALYARAFTYVGNGLALLIARANDRSMGNQQLPTNENAFYVQRQMNNAPQVRAAMILMAFASNSENCNAYNFWGCRSLELGKEQLPSFG